MLPQDLIDNLRERADLIRIVKANPSDAHDDDVYHLVHSARPLAVQVKPVVDLFVAAGMLDVHLLLDRQTLRFLADNDLISAKDLVDEPSKPYAEVHFNLDRASLGIMNESRGVALKVRGAIGFARPRSQEEVVDGLLRLIKENTDLDFVQLRIALDAKLDKIAKNLEVLGEV